MTKDEWYGLCAFVNELFAQPLPVEKAEVYFEFVARDVPEPVMRQAIRLVVQRGAKFLPSAGELAEACRLVTGEAAPGELDAPSFGEVIGVIDGARFLSRRAAVERVTEKLGSTAAAWMCAEGVERLRGMELAGEYAGAQRRMLQQSYESFCAGQADRARRGLALLEATPDGRTARSDLRRVEPLKAIEGGEAA